MNLRNPGRLAIHRRSDELAFLQHRLHALEAALQEHPAGRTAPAGEAKPGREPGRTAQVATLERERDLADELLHTRQVEPLGETLQRRLAMAERICRDLARSAADGQERPSRPYQLAEIERQAVAAMLKQWWDWLQRS